MKLRFTAVDGVCNDCVICETVPPSCDERKEQWRHRVITMRQ